MPVSYGKTSSDAEGLLVADRPLYLDATGSTLVEHGHASAASLLAAQGHPISKHDTDRLGLVADHGKIVQDHPTTIADLRAAHNALLAEQADFAATALAYKTERAVKEIPNTMEHDRVALDARVESARLTLAQAIKTASGKVPELGESQSASSPPDAE